MALGNTSFGWMRVLARLVSVDPLEQHGLATPHSVLRVVSAVGLGVWESPDQEIWMAL